MSLDRVVRFCLDSNQVYPVRHLNDMTHADAIETWYGPAEYKTMRSRIFRTLGKARKGAFQETSRESMRGLEHRTKEGTAQRQSNKFKTLSAVLTIYHAQRTVNEFDPTKVAEVYAKVSASCRKEARKLALMDQEFIQDDLDKMREGKYGLDVVTPRDRFNGLLRKLSIRMQPTVIQPALPETVDMVMTPMAA